MLVNQSVRTTFVSMDGHGKATVAGGGSTGSHAPDGAAPDPASADPYNDPNWKHVMDETYSAADGENYRYQGEPLTVFPRPVKARYLLMRIKSDQGSFAKGDYHTGFSKIQFYTSKRGETLLMVR